MKKIFIGFTGHIGGGKTTAIRYLQEHYHAGTHGFSAPLRDILRRIHEPETRENLQKISTLLRETFGEDVLARIIAADVVRDDTDIVCVDGVRRPADIASLSTLPNFHLVHITAPLEVRFERLIQRAQNTDDAAKTFEEFQKDHKREAELEIGTVAAAAEITIDNSGTTEKLYSRIDEMMKKLCE